MYSSPYNNPSQPQWHPNPNNNGYPPLSTSSTPMSTLPRKPTLNTSKPNGNNSYDPSTPVNVNLSPYHSTPSPNPNSNLDAETRAAMMRTPSPTPSEQKALSSGAIEWKTLMNWRFWIRREWLWYYIILVVILVITALVTLYHEQIVHWLTPVTRWLHDLKFGWLVPIGILFVISFPPLFGHEIVAILCGLVWGLWVGFGIVSAGTFLGEVGNFYAFRYICSARGEKMEKNNISYACLAKVVRDGGFWVALVARYSAIPGHFTTAVFSTCGMSIIVFSLAAILSMPKQLITVYLGVILEQSSDDPNSPPSSSNSQSSGEDTKSKIISRAVLAITVLVTVLAMWFILRRMNNVKRDVLYERRKARQRKLIGARMYPNGGNDGSNDGLDNGSEIFVNGNQSLTEIPLRAPSSKKGSSSGYGYEREEGYGYGYGYGGGGGGGQKQAYPFGPEYQPNSNNPSGASGYGQGRGRQGNENIMYAPKPRHLEGYHSPANGYLDYGAGEGVPGLGRSGSAAAAGGGEGHVAPGAAIVGMRGAYDYTPTRQDSDPDDAHGMGRMATQQEEYLKKKRQETFPPPGIPVSPTSAHHRGGGGAEPRRELTSSPDNMISQSRSMMPLDSSPSAYIPTSSQSYPGVSATSISTPASPGGARNQSQSQSTTTTYPYAYAYSPETREVGGGAHPATTTTTTMGGQRPPSSGVLPNPFSNPTYLTSSSPHQPGHGIEPTDATFHTAIDHGHGGYGTSGYEYEYDDAHDQRGSGHGGRGEPSLVESELHAPGAFPKDPPPSYSAMPR